MNRPETVILPTQEEIGLVNQGRVDASRQLRDPNTFVLMEGPCGTDELTLPNGEYSVVEHGKTLSDASSDMPHLAHYQRQVGTKSRTNTGRTGLIHMPGGPLIASEQNKALVNHGVRLTSEIIDESDFAVTGPWISIAWSGARNADDGGPRNLLRPTEADLEDGVEPIPTLVKNGSDGGLKSIYNAITTLRSEVPVTRTRFTLDGIVSVTTFANTNVGVILRGNNNQKVVAEDDDEHLEDVIANEYQLTRDHLDEEFGPDEIAIVVDVSHRHAAIAGGGETGQIRCINALSRLIRAGVILPAGMMAETYIHPDKQPEDGIRPGQSRYDKCVRESKILKLNPELNTAISHSLLQQAA